MATYIIFTAYIIYQPFSCREFPAALLYCSQISENIVAQLEFLNSTKVSNSLNCHTSYTAGKTKQSASSTKLIDNFQLPLALELLSIFYSHMFLYKQ